MLTSFYFSKRQLRRPCLPVGTGFPTRDSQHAGNLICHTSDGAFTASCSMCARVCVLPVFGDSSSSPSDQGETCASPCSVFRGLNYTFAASVCILYFLLSVYANRDHVKEGVTLVFFSLLCILASILQRPTSSCLRSCHNVEYTQQGKKSRPRQSPK